MFSKYVSNVPLGTGTNFILSFGGDRRVRARAYFRVEMSGTFDYRIFYINSVNSTYDQGAVAYRNRSGGHFRVVSASLADGGQIGSADAERLIKESHHESLPPLDGAVTLTFDGETSRDVTPDEHIVSDPVRLTIPDGHYLAFEWEIIGDGIPCTPDSRALTFVDTGDGYSCRGWNSVSPSRHVRLRQTLQETYSVSRRFDNTGLRHRTEPVRYVGGKNRRNDA